MKYRNLKQQEETLEWKQQHSKPGLTLTEVTLQSSQALHWCKLMGHLSGPPGKQIWKPKHVRELGEELGTSSTGIPGVGENRLQALLHRFPWDEEQSMSFWGLGFFNHSHSLRSAPFLAYPGSSLKVVF